MKRTTIIITTHYIEEARRSHTVIIKLYIMSYFQFCLYCSGYSLLMKLKVKVGACEFLRVRQSLFV